MTIARSPRSCTRRASVFGPLVAFAIGMSLPTTHFAQGAGPAPRASFPERAEQGVRWSDLKPAQQAALKPLERDWSGIETPNKQKWLELSARFPKMSPAEQARVQERMAEWAKLTPPERGQARLRFQEAKQLSAPDRQARWDAYQALSPEQKQQLAARAVPVTPVVGTESPRKTGQSNARTDKPSRDQPQAKSNIVPNPAFAASPKSVAPTVVQVRPGATTTPITRRPAPPPHQQTGLPKIAATPEFVDKATLLPQRGPQGAAARPPAAAATKGEAAPRR